MGTLIALYVFYNLMTAWALMLLLGVIHHEVIPACPAIGFWSSLAITVVLRVVIALLSPSSKP